MQYVHATDIHQKDVFPENRVHDENLMAIVSPVVFLGIKNDSVRTHAHHVTDTEIVEKMTAHVTVLTLCRLVTLVDTKDIHHLVVTIHFTRVTVHLTVVRIHRTLANIHAHQARLDLE